MPGAPAVPGAPPAATTGLPQSTFWGSVLQGFQMAPAYEMQQLQLDTQRLQNYEQYYNVITPQALANPQLARDPRMISLLATAAKQAGVPPPITTVNGQPQLDLEYLGRQALNNFIEKNPDLWFGKWSSTQRTAFAQRMNWIPQGYNWQADDVFTAKQSETLPEKQRTEADIVREFNDAVKANDPEGMILARSDYEELNGPGSFIKAVPQYKTFLKQVADNFAVEGKKAGLDLQKEVVEIDNDLLQGQYIKAETVAKYMEAKLNAYKAAAQPALDESLIEERKAITQEAIAKGYQAIASGQKLPTSFLQNTKTIDSQMNTAMATSQSLLSQMTDPTIANDPNKKTLILNQVQQNQRVIKALEPQYFGSHLLLDVDAAQSSPTVNLPIAGTGYHVLDALGLAQQLLQKRAFGIKTSRAYYVAAARAVPSIVKWLDNNYPDLTRYILGLPTSFENKAKDTTPATSAPAPISAPSPVPGQSGGAIIPMPPPLDDSGDTDSSSTNDSTSDADLLQHADDTNP